MLHIAQIPHLQIIILDNAQQLALQLPIKPLLIILLIYAFLFVQLSPIILPQIQPGNVSFNAQPLLYKCMLIIRHGHASIIVLEASLIHMLMIQLENALTYALEIHITRTALKNVFLNVLLDSQILKLSFVLLFALDILMEITKLLVVLLDVRFSMDSKLMLKMVIIFVCIHVYHSLILSETIQQIDVLKFVLLVKDILLKLHKENVSVHAQSLL